MEEYGEVFFWLGIAALFFIIYLIIYVIKVGRAKQFLSEAEKAKNNGDDASAVNLFKKALWNANEKPEMETDILLSLSEIYKKNNINYDFDDYKKLIEQFKILKKKSSHKSIREMGKVNKLKKELIDRMPELS